MSEQSLTQVLERESLYRLADLAGIEVSYHDYFGVAHHISEDTLCRILTAMGFQTETDEQIHAAIAAHDLTVWQRILEPVMVIREGELPLRFSVTAPNDIESEVQWVIREEGGRLHQGTLRASQCALEEARELNGRVRERRLASLHVRLPLGYHELTVTILSQGARITGTMSLITVPESCYVPPTLSGDGRVFGLAVQLYSLRSKRNWGIGDFSDLRTLATLARERGIAAIGLNPLHELDPINPAASSPYSPSSRRTISPTYIDVEAVPEFNDSAEAKNLVNEPAFLADLATARRQTIIDYAPIVKAKRRVLEACYRTFRATHLDTEETARGTAFHDYMRSGSQMLERLCLFNVLSEHFAADGKGTWHHWPLSFQNVNSSEVTLFAQSHRSEIEFFAYVQWEAERQLAAASAACANMEIGLYCDLAVGVDGSSADTWALQNIFVSNVGVGAPPDLLNRQGQSWGLVPFSPVALRENAYADFAQLLRANMRSAGALRIDHAMSLLRLFWVPHGISAAEGAYVRYPVNDLIGIVALESRRNRCMVIGEDLGTVPDGFRDVLEKARLLSYRLAFFEREGDADFIPPERYPRYALASVGTHDLPTLAGWWNGQDIEVRAQLGTLADRSADEAERVKDRNRLLDALVRGGDLSSEDASRLRSGESGMYAKLARAAYRFVARTPSLLVMVQVEDIFGVVDAINVPGTVTEQPNWKRRLQIHIEDFQLDESFLALTRIIREIRSTRAPQIVPTATYRMQFHAGFTFRDAEALGGYLSDLGISHLYASPFLKATPGSKHGYDIIDHNSLNPEIGSDADFERMITNLHRRGVGLMLDFVPNHMGVAGSENSWWLDVLEWGERSQFASFFDIDWHPMRLELDGKVLLPILGEHYGSAIENNTLRLRFSEADGKFSVWYYSQRLPISPLDYATILLPALEHVRDMVSEQDSDMRELERVFEGFQQLRVRIASEPGELRERADELINSLRGLAARPAIAASIEKAVRSFDATQELGVDRLHALLETQSYKIAFWRAAFDEINYRRFFDVNELAGLRMELAECLALSHRFIFELIEKGSVQGLRIDHIDGLFDPASYCKILQTRAEALNQPIYLVVEKIVARHERLREDWLVDGTTGYEFMNVVNGLFIDGNNEDRISRLYSRVAPHRSDYNELVVECKKRIMDVELASELTVLADTLVRIAGQDLHSNDFTRNSLRVALREITANFPVYRTYITAEEISADDRRYIEWAVARARKASVVIDDSTFDFVRSILTTDAIREGKGTYDPRQVIRFAMKFQQYTSPVTAKGVEDTCFYRFNRLVSLNEVGGDPERFGTSLASFHRFNSERAAKTPHALSSTATHDAKRGEDVRTRIDVISEFPGAWARAFRRWSRFNANKKRTVDEHLAPDANDEYFIYQTLLGTWPLNDLEDTADGDDTARNEYIERIEEYLRKALREAKVHSSWALPNVEYEDAALSFVRRVLDRSSKSLFLSDFLPLAQNVAYIGALSSLSQTVLKFTAPGIPDIYQGGELWDYSLVDPDNRRPVDYTKRTEILQTLRQEHATRDEDAFAGELLDSWQDGRIKMYLTWKLLTLRQASRECFLESGYLPLEATGPFADNICAFARDGIIVIVPRLLGKVIGASMQAPVGDIWENTRITLPNSFVYQNIFTGARIEPTEGANGPQVEAREIFARLPVAVLQQIPV
jgi:(1->4)-alpha-D-glucan 1-alpha-D-glucosylmutase